MQKRSSKPPKRPTHPRDLNALAALIVSEATAEQASEGDVVPEETGSVEPTEEEIASAAARMLGRLGGLKGGKARAAKLTAEERSAIARKAAATRWSAPRGKQ